MRLFGLIGYPLGHSFSKSFFTSKFENEGISNCGYDLFPISKIHDLPALLNAKPNLAGLNVTIPYKRDVLQYLDVSNIPTGLEACNCIKIKEGKLTGYNTDVVGFERSFLTKWKPEQRNALVLGSGGGASAVIFVLQKLGINFKVVGRNKKTGVDHSYETVTPELIEQSPIIINTTPLGTYPEIEGCPQIPYEFLTRQHYLFDLVYNPAKTVFLQRGEEKGAVVQNGYDMLVYQAEEAWRIWNMEV